MAAQINTNRCSDHGGSILSPSRRRTAGRRLKRRSEAEVRPTAAFADAVVDAQNAQRRVEADAQPVAGFQLAELDGLVAREGPTEVGKDDAFHRINDGKSELRIEHEHPIARELAEVVAAHRLAAADAELLMAGQRVAPGSVALAEHGSKRQRLPVSFTDLEVRAVVRFVLGKLRRAAQISPRLLHRQAAAEPFRRRERVICRVRPGAQRQAAGAPGVQ